jgi:Tfp pilus assembly protein PilZ
MALHYPEDRDDTRFDHISPLQVKDLSTGEMFEARMQNHSNGGIYFESDGILQKGSKIYICMHNSPYSQSSGVLEYYTGKVMWRKFLKRSSFNFGYGVQLFSDSSKQDIESKDCKKEKDLRKNPRKPFFRTVQIGTNKGVFKGRTKNISSSGVFISSEAKLELGQVLKMHLSFKGKPLKISGQIVWLNDEGFGLKFKKIK